MVEGRDVFYLKADIELEDDFLRALSELGPQISLRDARKAFAQSGLRDVTIVPAEDHGTFHEIFFAVDDAGDEWVLKANRLSAWYSDRSPVRERNVSELLRTHDLAHGTVILADSSRRIVDFDFEVLKRVDGNSLREFDDNDELVARHQPAVARYLRRLHSIPGTYYGLVTDEEETERYRAASRWGEYLLTRLDDHIATLTDARIISGAAAASISVFMDREAGQLAVSRPRLLHGDCGPHNIVLSERGHVAMIDWEDALFGDPMFDVALWATFNPVRRWQGFFEAYFEESWTPDLTFWLYFLRISLAKSVVRLRFGYRDIPGREPSAGRIFRAMTALHLSKD